MENKKITELSNEDLLNTEKKTKALTSVFAGVLLVLFGITTYMTFTKGFTALGAVPIALLPILIVNIKNLKAMKE
jgi:hypothetical protein